jgi:hypothetical protein
LRNSVLDGQISMSTGTISPGSSLRRALMLEPGYASTFVELAMGSAQPTLGDEAMLDVVEVWKMQLVAAPVEFADADEQVEVVAGALDIQSLSFM